VRLIASTLALAATLSFLAAGCGSSQSAEEKWAGSVCSSVADWQDQIKKSTDNIKAQVQSPSVGIAAKIKGEVSSAVDATDKLASDLKANGPPNTEGSTKAKQELEAFATQLQTTATKARDALASLSGSTSLSDLGAKLGPLAPELEALSASAKSTLNSVSASGSKLKKGFQDAAACKQYR
jgi:deoxyribodipyrimidine photolyase